MLIIKCLKCLIILRRWQLRYTAGFWLVPTKGAMLSPTIQEKTHFIACFISTVCLMLDTTFINSFLPL